MKRLSVWTGERKGVERNFIIQLSIVARSEPFLAQWSSHPIKDRHLRLSGHAALMVPALPTFTWPRYRG